MDEKKSFFHIADRKARVSVKPTIPKAPQVQKRALPEASSHKARPSAERRPTAAEMQRKQAEDRKKFQQQVQDQLEVKYIRYSLFF